MASEQDKVPTHSGSKSDDNNSSDDSDSGSETDTLQTEWLATTRQKRTTAGNRMKSMLQNEEPDSDLELLFAEDDDDQGFSDAEAEGSDVQMDSSSDSEDENNAADDLEGEQELERQAKEKRTALRKRKAQAAIPAKFRKKVRIDPAASAPSTAASTPTAAPAGMPPPPPRPKKKSERASWLPSEADLPTRSSSRSTTRESKQLLHAQMQEREERRLKQVAIMQKKAAKMEALKKPPMTQAQRLAEAEQVEKRNSKSLNRWEEAERQREEERMKKLRALSERKLEGPVLTFWSGKGTGNGRLVVMEEKPVKKKREKKKEDKGKGDEATNGSATGNVEQAKTDVFEPGKTVQDPKDTTSKEPAQIEENPSVASTAVLDDTATKQVDETTSVPSTETLTTVDKSNDASATNQNKVNSEAPAVSAEADEPTVTPSIAEGSIPSAPTEKRTEQTESVERPEQTNLVPKTEEEKQPPVTSMQSLPVPKPPTSADASAPEILQAHNLGTTSGPTAPDSAQPGKAHLPATQTQAAQGSTSLTGHDASSQSLTPGPPDSYIHDTFMRPIEDSPTPGGAETVMLPENPKKEADTGVSALAEGLDDVEFTRNAIIYQSFNENAIKDKQIQTQILLGWKMTRLAKPTPHPICPITNHPARYRDPSTGIHYYNSFAYREIQRLSKGEYRWSSVLGAWVGSGKCAARGVPGRFLNPEEESPNKQALEEKMKKAAEGGKAAESNTDTPQGAADTVRQQSKSEEAKATAAGSLPGAPAKKADVEMKEAAQDQAVTDVATAHNGQPQSAPAVQT